VKLQKIGNKGVGSNWLVTELCTLVSALRIENLALALKEQLKIIVELPSTVVLSLFEVQYTVEYKLLPLECKCLAIFCQQRGEIRRKEMLERPGIES
jgi:hypothetical protein